MPCDRITAGGKGGKLVSASVKTIQPSITAQTMVIQDRSRFDVPRSQLCELAKTNVRQRLVEVASEKMAVLVRFLVVRGGVSGTAPA